MCTDLSSLKKLYVAGRKEEVETLLNTEEYRQPYFHRQLEVFLSRDIDRACYVNLDWSKAYRFATINMLHCPGGDYLRLSLDLGLIPLTFELAGSHGLSVEELRRMFDLNAPELDLNKSFMEACELGHLEVVKLLLERVDPCYDEQTGFTRACLRGRIDVVRLLLVDGRVDPDYVEGACFEWACENNHVDVVDLLLKDGRVNFLRSDTFDCLSDACDEGHLELVRVILRDPRIDPTFGENSCLRRACESGRIEVVRLLLEDCRVDLCPETSKSLIQTLLGTPKVDQKKREEVKDILMTYGRNAEGKFKTSYLALACWVGCLEVVDEMLHDACIDSEYISRCIEIVCQGGDLPVLSRLIADPRANSLSPLTIYHFHRVLERKDVEILQLLITIPAFNESLTLIEQMECYALLFPDAS